MNDFEEFNVTPELTLDPFQEEKKETPQIYQEAEPETPEIVLTPEEKNMVSAFAEKIDLANSNMILQYGAGTQKKIADFSEKALENVKTKDLGEVGTLLSDVVTELKNFDAEEERKGIMGFFFRIKVFQFCHHIFQQIAHFAQILGAHFVQRILRKIRHFLLCACAIL